MPTDPGSPVCGPLDVGDVRAHISTAPVPSEEWRRALDGALASPAFDGAPSESVPASPFAIGRTTVAKAQHREHELLETALWFGQLRGATGITAPRLRDMGIVETATRRRWWLVLERLEGTEQSSPTNPRLRALGEQLRIWHEKALPHGLRLDDPGALGVLLGQIRAALPRTYPAVADAFARACEGLAMRPVHGDVAVGHNSLFQDDELSAILDPGAVPVAPPMLDLAWCLAVDLPRGGHRDALLTGYGRDGVDEDVLDRLLPHMLLRRMLDTERLGRPAEAAWLRTELRSRWPWLLGVAGLSETG